jgi:hypothetical protein
LPLSFSLPTALEPKVEELHSCLGWVLDFVKAHGSSLGGRLDDVQHCVRGVAGLSARQGAATVLLVEELWTDCNLWES